MINKLSKKPIIKYCTLILMLLLLLLKINMIIFLEANNINLYEVIDEQKLDYILVTEDRTTVYFYKNNCLPCNEFKEIVNEYIENNNYKIYAIDVESDDIDTLQISDKYNIKFTPTIIVFDRDKEISRLEELVSYDTLNIFLEGGG